MQVIGSLRVGSVQYKHTHTLTKNQGWERGRYTVALFRIRTRTFFIY